jgi:prevent-host-death family protein
MSLIQTIPKTELARRTRQIIQAVQRGQTVVVESHGQPEAAIIDIFDYHLLRAVLAYHTHKPAIDQMGLDNERVAAFSTIEEQVKVVIAHYLAEAISLSRAAELLGTSWLDLRTRFFRLDIPLRSAPATIDETLSDAKNATEFLSSP